MAVLSDQRIRRLFDERLGFAVRSLEIVHGRGSVNEVVVVGLDMGAVVRRANAGSNAHEFEKEAACLVAAAERGIPSPRVVAVGEFDGCAFMVEEYISSGAADAVCAIDQWRTLGRYVRVIHAVPTRGFGRDFVGGVGLVFGDSWERFVDYNVTSLTASDAIVGLGFSRDETRRLAKRIEHLAQTQLTFGLSHGDLALRNLLVGADGRTFLLDWGCAEANVVPHFDIAETLRTELSADSDEFVAFLDGYGLSRSDFNAQESDRTAVMALCRADLLQWSMQRQPESIPHYAAQFRRALDEALRHD